MVHYRGGRSTGTNFPWEINGSEGDVVVRGASGHLQYGRVEVLVGRPGGGRLVPSPVPDRFVGARRHHLLEAAATGRRIDLPPAS